ncbi:MAG: hypothetical protein JJU11_10405, partial [Candidatus Sumerlaeia bacterium]|nr:hypothetical protein [Candidatus Sumerlaeia bacterium]
IAINQTDEPIELWLITPGIPLQGGVTYDISFFVNSPEKLDVFLGTSSMGRDGLENETLFFSGASATEETFTFKDQFTPATTDEYQLGFRASLLPDEFVEIDVIRVVEQGLPVISLAPEATGTESEGSVIFPVTFDPAPVGPIDIDYRIINETTSDDDFAQNLAGTFTFSGDGVTTSTNFIVYLVDDDLPELEETFQLVFESASDGYIYAGEARGIIPRNNFVTIFTEDFEDATALEAPGWTISDTGNPGNSWEFQFDVSYGTYPAPSLTRDFDGRYAHIHSYSQLTSSGLPERVGGYLESPPFSTEGYGVVRLSYTYSVRRFTLFPQEARTEVSVDGGSTWTTVAEYNPDQSNYFALMSIEHEEINISPIAAGYPDVRIRFYYDDLGYLNGLFGVDDIEVIAAPLAPDVRTIDLEVITPTFEEGESLVFDVFLDAPNDSDNDITMKYLVHGLVDQDDFAGPLSGTLRFSPGEDSKTVTIPSVDDDIVKGDKDMVIELSNIGGRAIFGATGGMGSAWLLRDPADLGPPLSETRVYVNLVRDFGPFSQGSLMTGSLDRMDLLTPVEELFPVASAMDPLPDDPDSFYGYDIQDDLLYRYSLSTGSLVALGAPDLSDGMHVGPFGSTINGLAFSPLGGAYALSEEFFLDSLKFTRLISFDATTGVGTEIDRLLVLPGYIAFRGDNDLVIDSNGTFYTVFLPEPVTEPLLLRIDPETALVDIIGVGMGFTARSTNIGLAIDPVTDSIFMVAESTETQGALALYYVDKDTGVAAMRSLVGTNAPQFQVSAFTIVDDKTPPPSVLTISGATATKGDGSNTTMEFTIGVFPPLDTPETVDITLVDQTAKAGIDFIDSSAGGVVVPAGVSSFTFPVEIIEDLLPKTEKTFAVVLSNPSGTMRLSPINSATGTIPEKNYVTIASFDFNDDPIGEPPVGWHQGRADDFDVPPDFFFHVGVEDQETSSESVNLSGGDGTPFAFINVERILGGRFTNPIPTNQAFIAPPVDTTGYPLGVVLRADIIVTRGGTFSVLARDGAAEGPWITLLTETTLPRDQHIFQLPTEVISTATEIAFTFASEGTLGGVAIDNVVFLGGALPPGSSALELVGINIREGNSGEIAENPLLVLTHALTNDLEVDYEITGGTAINGIDYNIPETGTIIIPAGQTTVPFPLNVVGNDIAELDKTIEISFVRTSEPIFFFYNRSEYVVTIENDDLPALGNMIAYDTNESLFYEIDSTDGTLYPFLETDRKFIGMDFFSDDLDTLFILETNENIHQVATLDLSSTDFPITIGPVITGEVDVEERLAEMAYDPANERMVVSTFTPSGVFRYYDLDLESGVKTLLATFEISDGILPVTIGFDGTGQPYTTGASFPGFAAGFYALDLAAETVELIGPTGVGNNGFAQGMLLDWDYATSTMRAIYYWQDEEGGRLDQHYGTFNTETGLFTSIVENTDETYFTGMAVRSAPSRANEVGEQWMIH